MPAEGAPFFPLRSKMASMRESDTGLWLHNKLGSTDELWAPPSIASLLTAAVIDNIRLCFHGLSSPVKLKLLLGILHLPRRAVDEVSQQAGGGGEGGIRGCHLPPGTLLEAGGASPWQSGPRPTSRRGSPHSLPLRPSRDQLPRGEWSQRSRP